MGIIKLPNEIDLMKDLGNNTVRLIHCTDHIPAIKILVQSFEIIDLNLKIEQDFEVYKDGPPWDLAALYDLNQMRQQLVVYHKLEFKPPKALEEYSKKVQRLYSMVKLRLTNYEN